MTSASERATMSQMNPARRSRSTTVSPSISSKPSAAISAVFTVWTSGFRIIKILLSELLLANLGKTLDGYSGKHPFPEPGSIIADHPQFNNGKMPMAAFYESGVSARETGVKKRLQNRHRYDKIYGINQRHDFAVYLLNSEDDFYDHSRRFQKWRYL
jgi:hypothetical protein